MNDQVTKLKVDDEDFLVASLIERCPKVMMLRELVQNALEAAFLAPPGRRLVEIGAEVVDGVNKLRIRNTGPGLDARELHRMCDLASSIGKLKGLDGNFGIGAKVASLPSNPAGMRYRSCKGGRVSEVILAKRGGSYGRLWRPAPGASDRQRMVDVADVTDEVARAGGTLDEGWTEVVLMGARPEQDTVLDPYGGDPAEPAYWVAGTLHGRYFRLPPGVEVVIEPPVGGHQRPVSFATVTMRADSAFLRHETVPAGDGIRLHYFRDAALPDRPWRLRSDIGALQPAEATGALVFRDEIYDSIRGSRWAYLGPNFGLTFGARHTSVYVELPDDYPVLIDGYRQSISRRGGDQAQLGVADFAHLVRRHRPAWLLAMIESEAGQSAAATEIGNEIAVLAERLRLAGSQDANGRPFSLPAIVTLRDPVDIRARWMEGRAATFYPESNELLVNLNYEAVVGMRAALEAVFLGPDSPAELSELIAALSERAMVRRVSRALLFGLAKRHDPDHWQPGHQEKIVAPESLTLAADDYDDSLDAARRLIAGRLQLRADSRG